MEEKLQKKAVSFPHVLSGRGRNTSIRDCHLFFPFRVSLLTRNVEMKKDGKRIASGLLRTRAECRCLLYKGPTADLTCIGGCEGMRRDETSALGCKKPRLASQTIKMLSPCYYGFAPHSNGTECGFYYFGDTLSVS